MPKALSQTKLEDQRRYLVGFIETNKPQGSLNNSVTVVFDGSLDVYGGAAASSSVNIVFSKGESADDKIKSMVAQAQNMKNIVVVTDDRDIQYAVRALGAKVRGVSAFLRKRGAATKKAVTDAQLNPSKNPGPTSLARTEKKIPKVDEFRITSEMGEIWLKPGKGRRKTG